jgi:hypothetical protein
MINYEYRRRWRAEKNGSERERGGSMCGLEGFYLEIADFGMGKRGIFAAQNNGNRTKT